LHRRRVLTWKKLEKRLAEGENAAGDRHFQGLLDACPAQIFPGTV